MALDILHDNWGPYTHTEVENALKAYLAVLENRINQAIQSGGVGLADLSAEVQALLNKANTALQPENIAAWAKAQNKPGYTVSEITGVEGFQNLLAKLQDMDAKIQAAAQSGGVDPDDEMSSTSENVVQNKVIKAYVDNLVASLQATLNTITQDGATQGVIDTFNEVKAFLEGISSSDTLAAKLLQLEQSIPTSAQQAVWSAKQDAIANLATIIANAAKGATSVQKVKVGSNGTEVSPDQSGLATLPINIIPTIDQVTLNWVINGIDSGVKAQGPKGDSVIGGSVDIVNSFEGGETKALSAEMGKVLRNAITTLYNAFANYAFYGIKPTLNWGSTVLHFGMSATLSNVTISSIKVNGVTQSYSSLSEIDIVDGQSLEVTLDLPSNLYVIDDSTFSVKVSGNTLNTNVQGNSIVEDIDDAQVVISIASVYGDVSIKADGITYVGYSEQNSPLKSMFDGMNVDWDNHEWVDKMDNSRVLKMNPNMTAPASGDHVEFDAVEDSTYAVAESTSAMVNVSDTVGTVEAVIKGITCNNTSGNTGRLFLRQTKYIENGTRKPLICANIMYSALFNNGIGIGCLQTGESNRTYPNVWLTGKSAITPSEFLCFSVSNTRAYLGGQTPALTRASGGVATIYTGTNDYITLGVMSWLKEAGDFSTAHKGSTAGSAYCVRVYGRALEESEVLHNYKIDKKRFNLA